MPINFIPNDPAATSGPAMRRKKPRVERSASVAGFSYVGTPPTGVYDVGSPEFLHWQTREAALAALATYETLAGKKVSRWARSTSPRRLILYPNKGNDLNAYYDGESLSFFEYTTGTTITYSGASTDVVAHEAGHALLDQAHPDLWDSTFPEVAAFHEAFGDCIAIVTALSDSGSRQLVRKSLLKQNFIEATAEDLSAGVRRALGSSHPASQPRHARNSFKWQLPTSLPTSGPPNVLSGESHSFARVFTGCFYDTIVNMVGASVPTSAALKKALGIAGALLIQAAAEAPESPRFFQSVGRTMILLDQQINSGANHAAIRDAFEAHSIALGSAAMLAPTAPLGGPTTKRGQKAGGPLSRSALLDLRDRLGATPRTSLRLRTAVIGGNPVLSARQLRPVPLTDLDKRLKGVVAMAPRSVLVGVVDGSNALLGAFPEATAGELEVRAFVSTLLESNRIAFETGEARRGIAASAKQDERLRLPTHAVRSTVAGKVLTRVRFAC